MMEAPQTYIVFVAILHTCLARFSRQVKLTFFQFLKVICSCSVCSAFVILKGLADYFSGFVDTGDTDFAIVALVKQNKDKNKYKIHVM